MYFSVGLHLLFIFSETGDSSCCCGRVASLSHTHTLTPMLKAAAGSYTAALVTLSSCGEQREEEAKRKPVQKEHWITNIVTNSESTSMTVYTQTQSGTCELP